MTKFTGLGPPSQPVLVQYAGDGLWRIWLMYNKGVPSGRSHSGTYLLLYPDGHIERRTYDDTGTITQSVPIKPAGV